MLFAREVEAQPLDTPERRAALERRLRECAGQIRDEVLKRHYLDDFRERQAVLFGRSHHAGWTRVLRRNGMANATVRFAALAVGGEFSFAPDQLFRCPKGNAGPREILILALLLNHPALLSRTQKTLLLSTFLRQRAAPCATRCSRGRTRHDPHELHEKLFCMVSARFWTI